MAKKPGGVVESQKVVANEASPALSSIPKWVSEGSVRKYYRAVEQLRKESKPVTDEAVKELYTKWGGLITESL